MVFQCYVIIVVERITSVEQMKIVRPKKAERSVSFLSCPQWLSLLYVAYACKLVQRLFTYSQIVLIFVLSLLLLDKGKGR